MKIKALAVCGSFLIAGGALLSSCGNSSSPSTPSNPTATPTATTAIHINAGVVTTLAGQTVAGSLNATGTAASFSHPEGIAVDASGNVYISDTSNSEIRKISSGAVVSTFAGQAGSPGAANGTGTAASFNMPVGLGVDGSGNVYVADAGNDDIREISTGGVVITLAGTGSTGSTNATGTSASFDNPTGVAVDASGNVYVADQNNQLIRKITSGGVVSTFAGTVGVAGNANGTGTSASFNNPTGLAVDASGNVYVADQNNFEIRKITTSGVVSVLAGSGSSGSVNATGTSASFNHPYDVTVDAQGNVYVADGSNDDIREISPAGVVTTLAGTGSAGATNATGLFASFDSPWALAVNSANQLFVADTDNNEIREVQ
jgi:sugar lactone lactonase YvrE